MSASIYSKVLVAGWLGLYGFGAFAAPENPETFNFDGVLIDNISGNPMTGNVDLRFEIMDAGATCVLYKEDHMTVTLDPSGGFSQQVGTGTSVVNYLGLGWKGIFANKGATGAFAGCGAGVNLTPGSSRLVRVTVNSSIVLSPDFSIGSVPFATVADSVQGYGPADFKLALANDVRMHDLAGNPGNYISLKAPNGITGNFSFEWPAATGTANQVLTTNGAGILSWSTPATSATQLQGAPVSATAPSSGQVLTWNGTLSQWVPQSVGGGGGGTVTSISTGVGLAGGPITSSGSISLANTAVAAGSYGSATSVATFTVDPQGRLTAAGNQAISITSLNPAVINQNGATPGQVLKWNGAAWLPAADVSGGSFPVTSVAGKTGAVTLNAGDITGLGTAALKFYGTAVGDLVELDGAAKVPVGLLPNINQIQGFNVSPAAPSTSQVLTWNGSAWLPQTPGGGSDNLGNHVAISNIQLGSNWLSGDGGNEGVFVNANGRVGIGTSTITSGAAFEIRGTGSSASSMIVPRDTSGARPSGVDGMIRYNTSLAKFEAFENGAWTNMVVVGTGGGGGGTVTSVTTGTGLAGGPITTNGSIFLTNTGITSGSFGSATSVATFTVDAQGRLTAAGNQAIVLTSLNPAAINQNGASTGEVLKWNGAAWLPAADAAGSGSVTSVSTGVGLAGGPITSSGSISLANTSVGSGSYGSASSVATFTVDPQGRLTAAATVPIAITLNPNLINQGGATTNQVLKWNGSSWIPSVDGGADNMGNHIATTNIQLGANYLSGDGGAEGIRVDANGNVGIGTTTPGEKLHVHGTTTAIPLRLSSSNAGGYAGLEFENQATSITGLLFWDNTNNFMEMKTNGAYPMRFTPNGAEAMRITQNGNVGIGITSPGARFEVAQNITATTGNVVNARSVATSQHASPSSAVVQGAWNQAVSNSASSLSGTMTGTVSSANNAGNGTVTTAVGLSASVNNDSTGIISNAIGLQGSVAKIGTGNISNAMGAYFAVGNYTGGGSITNGYGVKIGMIDDTSGAITNKYSLYVEDPDAPSYFAGDIQLGNSLQGCSAPKEGSLRYNNGPQKIEMCDGTAWKQVPMGPSALYAGNSLNSSLGTGAFSTSATYYGALMGSVEMISGTDTPGVTRSLVAQPGVVANFHVKASQTPGSNWVYTIMKNGVATSVTCTVTSAVDSCNDTVNFVTVVPGDEIGLRLVTGGTGAASRVSWAVQLMSQ